MVKTQTEAECAELRRLLPSYADYGTGTRSPGDVRFYGPGIASRCQGHAPGVFCRHEQRLRHAPAATGALRSQGTTVGRLTADARGSAILKDLDLLRSTSRVRVGASRRHSLLEQLRQDALFLSERSYIDYSLLLGIHPGRDCP